MDKLITVSIFLITYILIASEKVPRHIVALGGALILVTSGIVRLDEAMTYVSWETIGLLFGMFILIVVLAEAGFFNWLALEVAERVRYDLKKIFILFPLLAGLLSTFMDSITVLLFLATLTYYVARTFKIDPVPLVIAEVCAANTGGAATLVGDPPNVILGTMLGFGFNDFVRNTGPISLISMLVIIGYAFWQNRKMLNQAPKVTKELLEKEGLKKEIKSEKLLWYGLGGMAVAVFLLVTHRELSELLHVDITAASASLFPALFVLAMVGREAEELLKASGGETNLLKKIDSESLLFFIGLFIVVGGLEKTGVIDLMAKGMVGAAGGNHVALLLILLWVGGITSAVVDNVPLALTMAYVLKDIDKMGTGPALGLMVWALSLGVDMGGNGTPVGASANVVAYSTMERHGLKIGWPRWMKLAIPPTFLAMLVSSVLIALKYYYHF